MSVTACLKAVAVVWTHLYKRTRVDHIVNREEDRRVRMPLVLF